MDELRKQFADEVEKIIQAELKALFSRPRTDATDEQMMCLNRISVEVNKLKFKDEKRGEGKRYRPTQYPGGSMW